ncbi:hypothetical protein WN48_09239 [Eufriesea mexicana]|nr:hypothetical protein WN48_09239 [Eufriesea mexicana]
MANDNGNNDNNNNNNNNNSLIPLNYRYIFDLITHGWKFCINVFLIVYIRLNILYNMLE